DLFEESEDVILDIVKKQNEKGVNKPALNILAEVAFRDTVENLNTNGIYGGDPDEDEFEFVAGINIRRPVDRYSDSQDSRNFAVKVSGYFRRIAMLRKAHPE